MLPCGAEGGANSCSLAVSAGRQQHAASGRVRRMAGREVRSDCAENASRQALRRRVAIAWQRSVGTGRCGLRADRRAAGVAIADRPAGRGSRRLPELPALPRIGERHPVGVGGQAGVRFEPRGSAGSGNVRRSHWRPEHVARPATDRGGRAGRAGVCRGRRFERFGRRHVGHAWRQFQPVEEPAVAGL